MRKTSVYLTDDEAEQLRHVAESTGRSQAELIREGVHRVLETAAGPRRFHSMGAGHGGGEPYSPWSAEELYKKVMGRDR